MDGYKSPEQLEAEAEALLKKHEEGTLDDDAYGEDNEDINSADDVENNDDAEPDKKPDKEEPEDGADDTKDPDNEGKDGDKDPDKEGDTDEEEPSTGDKNADKRIKDSQRAFHKKAGEAKRFKQMAEDAAAENEALRRQMAGGKQAPKTKPKVALSEERVKQLQKDYPDLADFFQSVHDTQVENVNLREQIDSGLKGVREERNEDSFMSEIKGIHSDAEKIQSSDEWTGWLETQPSYIQRAIYEGATAQEVADIITNYKRDTGRPVPGEETQSTEVVENAGDESGDDPAPSKPSKLEQAKAAASPTLTKGARQHKPGKGKGKTYSRAEIKRVSEDPSKQQWLLSEEGEKYQQDVMKAMQEGRITD